MCANSTQPPEASSRAADSSGPIDDGRVTVVRSPNPDPLVDRSRDATEVV